MLNKFLFLISISFFFLFSGYAQTAPQSPDFAIRFGANSSNYGQAVWGVKLDNLGNTYATGNFNATTNFNPLGTPLNLTAYSNPQDGFLAKYNSSGIAQWVIPFTSQSGSTSVANSNGGISVTTDASGNVYVTGIFWGTVDFDPSPTTARNLTSNGNFDIFIAKYNSTGQYQWAYSMGGSAADAGTKVVTDNSGNVYLATRFSSSSIETNTTGSGVSKVFTAIGPYDIAIIKYNASGVFQDAITCASVNNNEIVNDVQVDSNDNLFFVGTYSGTLTCGSLSCTAARFSDAFVLKLNSSLVPQFLFSIGGIYSDEGKNVAIDRNNDVIVSGIVGGISGYNIDMNNSGGSPSNITIVNQGTETFLSKYNNNGVFKWATITQGTSTTRIPRPMGLGIDSCNNIVISGSFTSTFDFDPSSSGGSFTSPSSWGGLVVKFTSLGEYLWGFIVTGSSANFFSFDYNEKINKYVVGGDLITNTTYPNVDVDPTSGTKNLTSFNANFGAALLALYPDPGNVIPTITLGTIPSVVNSATSFTIPYTATTGSPNQFSIASGTPNTMPLFSAVTNSTLTASPISVIIPASTANTYNFNFSVRNRASGCMSANMPLALVVNAPVSPPTITSFTPISAKPGDAITITGTNFNTTAANNIVFFGATKATVTAATATSLTVTVPIGATYAPITLFNTSTSLACASLANFHPIYSPAKTDIKATDFQAKQDFTTGTLPISAALGDLDGDGKPDIAVANYNSNTVSVFRNTSTNGAISSGSFDAKVDFAAGSNPRSVSIGDVDGDGKPDLVVANWTSNNVSILRNAASSGAINTGSFETKVDFELGSNPISVAISDVDADGKPDIAVVNYNSNSVSILKSTATSGSIGAGSFANRVDFTTGNRPTSVAIRDLDSDGKPDLAVTNGNSSNVSVLRNTVTNGIIDASSFATKVDYTTNANPFSIAIGDLDGDGKPDLAISNLNSNNISVLRNIATSGTITSTSFSSKVDFPASFSPYSVVIGDLDGDGKPDLAVSNGGSSNISVFRNTSTSGAISSGSFATKVDFATANSQRSILIGDLDGDTRPDLVSANYGSGSISIFRNADIITNTTWNGTTWSNGAPDATVDAIIASSTVPTASFSCKALTINSTFALTTTGITATVNGDITNNGNGIDGAGTVAINANSTINGNTITIPANATFNLINGTLTTGGRLLIAPGGNITGNYANISGTVTLQQSIIGQRGWRVLANPFSTAQTFATLASTNGITINTNNGVAGIADVRTFSNATNQWTNAGTSTTANQVYGLFIRGLASEVTGLNYTGGPTPFTYNASGTLNANSVSYQATNTSNTFMVGNPYAAPVTTAALTNGAGKPYYTYQITQGATLQDRRTRAGAWIVATGNSSTNATIPVLGVLAYQPTTTNSYLVSNTDVNTGGTVATNLFRTNNPNSTNNPIEQLALNLSSHGMLQDRWLLRYNATAKDEANDENDLKKLQNDVINFYSVPNNKDLLAIDARSAIASVALGITAPVGSYMITVGENSLPGGNQLYLHDKLLKSYTQLQPNTSYQFSVTADSNSRGNNRFEIVTQQKVTISNASGGNKLQVRVLNNIITQQQATIEVIGNKGVVSMQMVDAVGNVLQTITGIQTGIQRLQLNMPNKGMYWLRSSDKVATSTSKLIVQ